MVGDLKISKVGKCRILWQWSVYGELDLFGVGIQTISDVHSDLERHSGDESVDLVLKVRAVVDDVDIGVADPSLCCESVPLPGLVQSLQPRGVVLHTVVLLGPSSRGHHVNNLHTCHEINEMR